VTTNTTNRPIGLRASGGVLDRIVEAKAKRVEEAKLRTPIGLLRRSRTRDSRSFADALSRSATINIIAETKRRSPSKGIIREDFDPVWIAESYASGGAAALSVLCEEDFFGGSLEHLEAIRPRVELPLLRKDFIFDEYQLYESVLAGADAILLIVAILEDELLKRLLALANELGLDTLVEVHTSDEMERAARAGAPIIGVNNRNLTTFKVDLETSLRLAPLAPEGAILVSESGINAGGDIRRLRSAGFSAFLVGEHLMRAEHPGDALRSLVEAT
jgi:indole-3-glycerol phosphate synthase